MNLTEIIFNIEDLLFPYKHYFMVTMYTSFGLALSVSFIGTCWDNYQENKTNEEKEKDDILKRLDKNENLFRTLNSLFIDLTVENEVILNTMSEHHGGSHKIMIAQNKAIITQDTAIKSMKEKIRELEKDLFLNRAKIEKGKNFSKDILDCVRGHEQEIQILQEMSMEKFYKE